MDPPIGHLRFGVSAASAWRLAAFYDQNLFPSNPPVAGLDGRFPCQHSPQGYCAEAGDDGVGGKISVYNKLARLSQSHYQEVRSCQATFTVRNDRNMCHLHHAECAISAEKGSVCSSRRA